MGCKNCKQKKQNEEARPQSNEEPTQEPIMTNIMSDADIGGGFLMKIVIFMVLVVSIPLIIVVLIFQVFLNFFLPKYVYKINGNIKKFFRGLIDKYVVFIKEQQLKKKEKSFSQNRGYEEGSDLLDIEVYEDLTDNKKNN
jgi:hypothetical protein